MLMKKNILLALVDYQPNYPCHLFLEIKNIKEKGGKKEVKLV